MDSFLIHCVSTKDDYAILSYERAQAATTQGWFKDEIIPVEIPGPRGKPPVMYDKDEDVFNVRSSLHPQSFF